MWSRRTIMYRPPRRVLEYRKANVPNETINLLIML